MSIDKTLEERGNNYGEFPVHAAFTQGLKNVMRGHPNWYGMPSDVREALDMIQHKIGRILNGNPNFHDSWHDIIGYARLVEQRIEREARREWEVYASQETESQDPPQGANEAPQPANEAAKDIVEKLKLRMKEGKIPMNGSSNKL